VSGNAEIKVRRDTAANWTSADPVLADGELGFELNTGRHKIGDGTTAWSALDYFYQIHVGTTPPANQNTLWIDTN
jgi:hypothetical protein